MTSAQLMRIAKKRKVARQNKRECSKSNAVTPLTDDVLLQIHCNRLAAMERRRKHRGVTLRLEILNAHPRDSRISFQEETHIYTLDGQIEFPLSVSGVWPQFFDPVDMDQTVVKYFGRWSCDSSSKYHAIICDSRLIGLSDDQIMQNIVESWRGIGRNASQKGTYMHRQIELFLNGVESDESNTEMTQFKSYMVEVAQGNSWAPFRTEWSIFDETRMIAGQVDCIFKHTDKEEYHMVDWKRCAKPLDRTTGEMYGRFGIAPCNFLVDNSWSHYAAQQNLYAAILQDKYALMLSSMSLLQLHENQNTYKLIPIPNFFDVACEMLNSCKKGKSSFNSNVEEVSSM